MSGSQDGHDKQDSISAGRLIWVCVGYTLMGVALLFFLAVLLGWIDGKSKAAVTPPPPVQVVQPLPLYHSAPPPPPPPKPAPAPPEPTVRAVAPPPVEKPVEHAPPPEERSRIPVSEVQRYAASLLGDSDQFTCLAHIVERESGWNPHAGNPDGSYGVPQSLPGDKMSSEGSDWHDNPKTQVRWMVKYVKSRYGTACAAWAFWRVHSWY